MELPKNIDYKKYHGKGGMSTKHFGPILWDFLFTSILGRYPVKIDVNNKEHIQILKGYYQTLTNLKITLPCIFCRKSYEQFLIELPINSFLLGRIELFYWLYLMKDKVNKKLITQELEYYKENKQKLKDMFLDEKITLKEYKKYIYKIKKKIFVTVPTPPFKQVLDKYEQYRAKCINKIQKCL